MKENFKFGVVMMLALFMTASTFGFTIEFWMAIVMKAEGYTFRQIMEIAPAAANLVGVVFVAPWLEEGFKGFVFRKKGIVTGYWFVISFAIIEGILYVSAFVNSGMSLTNAILLRIPPILMHLWCFRIQTKRSPVKGWALATGFHFAWNLSAIILQALYNNYIA